MSSTLSLRSVIDFNRTRTRMIQLVNVGGVPNQPALDICNDTLQTLLSAPNNWTFNKSEVPPFTTIPNQQDYWLSGTSAIVDTAISGTRITKAWVQLNTEFTDPPGLRPLDATHVLATYSRFAPFGIRGKGTSTTPLPFAPGDSVTISGARQAPYNGTFEIDAVPSINSFIYELPTAGLSNDGGQGINNIGWLERATLEDFFSTAFVKPVREILVVASLSQESIVQPPFKVTVQFENIQQCGPQVMHEVLIRLWPVPSSQIWRVLIFFQLRPPIKTHLDDNWAPWPDELAYVLRSGVYAKALDHAEDPRAPQADAKWQQDIARALGIRQQQERHEAFFPDLPVLRGG